MKKTQWEAVSGRMGVLTLVWVLAAACVAFGCSDGDHGKPGPDGGEFGGTGGTASGGMGGTASGGMGGTASGGMGGTASGGTGGTGGTTGNQCKSSDGGGCDPLVSCEEADGGPICGACPSGYVGTGDARCIPTLTALTLSAGSLNPPLDVNVTMYMVSIPLVTQTLTLTPAVPSGAGVAIGGMNVSPGASWTSPILNLGATPIDIDVTQAGQPSRHYVLTVTRGGRQQALINTPNQSVAVAGDTLIVGAPYDASAATGVNNTNPGPTDDTAPNSGAAFVFVRNGSSWTQQAYLKASNTGANDNFGWSVAISGNTVVVGAWGESSAATGVDNTTPGQADDSASGSGAAYVFVRTGSTWTQQAYLKASNTGANDNFGWSVALDGDTAVIGSEEEGSAATGVDNTSPGQADDSASGSGAVYVFVRTGSSWAQQAYVKASNTDAGDEFGSAVAVAGNTLAVGAQLESSAATGVNSTNPGQSDNTAPKSGAAYIFVRSGPTWTQQAYVKASNNQQITYFGSSIAISNDTVVVGEPGGDSAFVFVRSGSTWSQQASLNASLSGFFGFSVAISDDALIVGAPYDESAASGVNAPNPAPTTNTVYRSGAAYLYVRSGSSWTQEAYLKASTPKVADLFGYGVGVSGTTLVVGATSSGALYVFE